MEDLVVDTNYYVTIPLTFEGRYSHMEEKNGVQYACFRTPGVTRLASGRTGPTYRKVPIDSILLVKSSNG